MPHDDDDLDHVRAPGVKKSDFIKRTSVTPGSNKDFFVDGQNYQISEADYIAGLGVTGSIVQEGAPTATALLDVDGTVNKIRGLENGPGILTSVSPEKGALIKHNFQSGAGGVAVLTDVLADSPIIRSIAAGAGMQVSGSNGSITLSTTGGPPSTDVVIINSVTDFPTPIADVITLETTKTYSLQGLINIGVNRIVMPASTSLFSQNRLTRGLITDNAGALITADDGGSIILREMVLMSTAGSFVDLSGGGAAVFEDVVGLQSAAVSTIDAMNVVSFRGFSLADAGSGVFGFLWSGANNEFNASDGFHINWTGTAYDFGTATFSRGVTIGGSERFDTVVGNTAISGAAASANIDTGANGLIYSSRFTGGGTFLSGITSSDNRWTLHNNDGLAETRSDGIVYMKDNATDTVITTQSVPVLVAGTWVEGSVSQFSSTTAGRLTYDGVSDQRFPVGATLSIEPASGNDVLLGAHIAVNGTPVVGSKITVTASNNNPSSLVVVWQMVFSTGDFVEVFVSNEDNSVDVLVSQITFIVN